MEIRQRSTEIMQLTVEQELQEDDSSPYLWAPATVIAFIMNVFTLVHSIMLTDGFFSTCKQYRNRVVKYVSEKYNFRIPRIKLKFGLRSMLRDKWLELFNRD